MRGLKERKMYYRMDNGNRHELDMMEREESWGSPVTLETHDCLILVVTQPSSIITSTATFRTTHTWITVPFI